MLRIVMDGAGDLPTAWISDFDINIIPININFGDRMFLQGIELSNDDFYRLADESKVVPKTSQPSPHQFVEFYQRIAKRGDTILSVHVTSQLSGTFASAQMAAQELAEQYQIIPIDSASGSAAMGYMCQEIRLMERAGAKLPEILARINFIREHVRIILTLDTLDYARKSGRVKTLQAALASLLNVKPVVVLRDGVLDMADRVRTRHRALDHILSDMQQTMGNRLVNAAVVHARDVQSGKSLMERVRQTLNCRELVLTDLSISVAANLGPGTVGIVAYPVEEG